jgi:hypothetical protein
VKDIKRINCGGLALILRLTGCETIVCDTNWRVT